ncbi:MAG: tripartite tricarboxylate transporter substrate binding protein [Pigmentiphaga sp.]|uniref:Bug family tripartite tricarboxylate transporter substrate binding protein n=1 Tax=Pigmentiphaga sp. TaxID=1977564 RepID=UPI0029A56891|nr:tripartite tricarboxylate transporter substrate binding protein [Pigmentiphaga sp.]MDX3906271.1 tripartite tricarboxylate transporter substrate binding protein [Pigmentiphaga sp.]
MFRRRFLVGLVAALALSCLPWRAATAQPWPARPITLLVSSGPGAGVDLFARVLAEQLQGRLGQSIIVENRPGASGMIAARLASRAAPDGYTIFLMPNTLVIAPYVLAENAATVSVMKELAPVIMPVSTMMVLAVNGKFADRNGIRTVSDLAEYTRRHPELPYSGGDNGSPMNVMGEQFKKEAGLRMTHIPYGGVAKTVSALIGGHVNVAWMPTSGNMSHFKNGALRALATSSPARSPQMPDVPTMAELGFKDVRATAWFGILAPLGTPQPIVGRLNSEINAVLGSADMRAKLAELGYDPEGGGPEALAAQMREDDERYRRLTSDLNIRAK